MDFFARILFSPLLPIDCKSKNLNLLNNQNIQNRTWCWQKSGENFFKNSESLVMSAWSWDDSFGDRFNLRPKFLKSVSFSILFLYLE